MDGENLNQESAQRAWEARQAAEAAARNMTSQEAAPQDPLWSGDVDLDPQAGQVVEDGSAADLAAQRAATVNAQEPAEVFPENPPEGPTTVLNQPAADTPPLPQPSLTDTQAQAVQDFQDQVTGQVRQNQFANPESVREVPEDVGFISREQARRNTQAARDRGVEIYLKNTGSRAIVRDLPFTDYVMLSGIPAKLRQEIDASFRDKAIQQVASTGTANVQGLEEAADMWDKGLTMANAICIASFVKPRLVQTEEELDGDPMTWTIDDVDPSDRLEVMAFLNRNRNKAVKEQGGAVAVAGFPG